MISIRALSGCLGDLSTLHHDCIGCRVASARNIAALDMSEMLGACALLEARGALRVGAGGAGGARARRVRLQWDEAELAAAMRDKPLLAAILHDTHCLAP